MKTKDTLTQKLKDLIREAHGSTIFNGTIYEMCRIWGYGPVTANRRLQEMRQPLHVNFCPHIQAVLNQKKYKIGYFWQEGVNIIQHTHPNMISPKAEEFLRKFPSKEAVLVGVRQVPVNALF